MKIREQICIWLFEKSKTPYAKHFKKNDAWNLTRFDLLKFPANSLGYELGLFLNKNDYHPIPKLEKHDAYHLITGYSTNVKDEIALQYFFLGSKKRSLYLYAVVAIGGILLPEYAIHYYRSFRKGKTAQPFYKWDIKTLLVYPLKDLQKIVFEQSSAQPKTLSNNYQLLNHTS